MDMKKYAPAVLRISISLLFLWFGLTSIFNYQVLQGYVPVFAYSFSLSIKSILLINGLFEVIFGLSLLIGFKIKISSLLLSIHTFLIAISLGYNEVAVRDFAIAFATFSIFLNGDDKWSLDTKLKRN